MNFCVKSSIGKVRHMNQDYYSVPGSASEPQLFIVADGMGGTNGGEVASTSATAAVSVFIKEHFKEYAADIPLLMRTAVSDGNKTVYRAGRINPLLSKMGTTMTAAYIDGDTAYIAQVGDSRAYLYNGELKQLTVDHSYVQELVDAGEITPQQARIHPERNKITRALGVSSTVQTDVFIHGIKAGELLMLCSDGLTSMIDDAAIETIIKNNTAPAELAQELVSAAEEAGGYDNVTVMCIRL